MSKKDVGINIESENKQKLRPILRFPEFMDAKDWEEKLLNEVSSSIFDGTHQTPNYKSEGVPFFSVENIVSRKKNKYISKDDYLVYIKRNKPEMGDILFTRIGKIGYSQVVTWEYEFYVYVTLAVIKKSEHYDSFFLHHYLQSSNYQTELIKKSLLHAVPPKINMDSLRKTDILLPSLNEQQKIADCLTSLEDLINAQSKKIEYLRAYKKGLLQQLFPVDGEKVPQIRFPDFQESGEWEQKQIGKFSKSFSGGTPKTTYKEFYGGNIPFIRSAEIGKHFTKLFLTKKGLINSSAKYVKSGDLLIAMYGANSGDVALSKINGAINQAILCVRSEGSNSFLLHFLKHKEAWIISTYIQGGQGNLSGKIIKSIYVPLPKKLEQQKIGDFLSSLDEQIEFQNIKIATLKAHKKGLMQRLFPSPNKEKFV